MAVVVSLSHSQNEIKAFKEEGLDIRPHRERMIKEDLEEKFKNENNPLRIVFVCAMWMTGFDVPSCSTIYLDKPMKNHTLMQTITRANRVFKDKASGLIVDYIGVFQELRKALQIYGSSSDKRIKEGEYPIEDKRALIKLLQDEIEKAIEFCQQRGVDVDSIINSEGFQRFASIQEAAIQLTDAEVIEPVDDSIEKIIVNDDLKREFVFLAANIVRIYRAIVPFPTDFDKAEKERLEREKSFFAVLADKICSFQTEETDISAVEGAMKDLLDQSITPVEYIIKAAHHTQLIDLSQLDIEKLQQIKTEFNNTTHKRTQLEKLRGAVNRKIRRMVRLNKKRVNFADKFQQLIDDYNSGSRNVELTFQQLLDLTQDLSKEEKRAIAEGLDEEELALFDLLTKPEITEKEEQQVKKVAKDLLKTLKREKKKVLVANWRQKPQSESAVKNAIHDVLHELPDSYSDELYDQVFEAVYQHIFESYYGDRDSIYSAGS
jgi:type I restriction enzyme R subunit